MRHLVSNPERRQRARSVDRILHIISGDIAGENLRKSGICGEVFVWRDVLYDGIRKPGWPENNDLQARADFLDVSTGGGLGREVIFETLRTQYEKLAGGLCFDAIILWFDACLFDQSMLCHILTCMSTRALETGKLISVGEFPGIDPFDGLGQLSPEQLASIYDRRRDVTKAQFDFAGRVEKAFALQDKSELVDLAGLRDAPLSLVPAAAARWLMEQPDEASGLGQLEKLVLQAVRSGLKTPGEIFIYAKTRDLHPIFWGDSTLWAKINNLATRTPPLVRLEGPVPLLPQWNQTQILGEFRIYPG
jgi:hypothetical protein